ncbi:caspase-6-like [Apostichopus japonicus]|uniref:caspase-6-like n=1 Tax=Stichopus japonicus TaxID=307972 RepID=UPI003AB70ED4
MANMSPISDLSYQMDHRKKRHLFIFNNDYFGESPGRTGTETDRLRLRTAFERFGFEIHVYEDYDASRIQETLIRVSRMDHSNTSCFVCVFLTHGDDGIIYGSDLESLRLKEDVFDTFKADNCRSLIGKPKIFIIQACRGLQADSPVQIGGGRNGYDIAESGAKVTIPTEADFLICYSSSEGHSSFRHSTRGSWFIQDLTRVLNQFGKTTDFIQMLTIVNRLVSERTIEGPGNPHLEGAKQMPCFLSKLTRKLCLLYRSHDWSFSMDEDSESPTEP